MKNDENIAEGEKIFKTRKETPERPLLGELKGVPEGEFGAVGPKCHPPPAEGGSLRVLKTVII